MVAAQVGWSKTVLFYSILLIGMAALNFVLGDKRTRVTLPLMQQLKEVSRNNKLWLLCLLFPDVWFIRGVHRLLAEFPRNQFSDG